MWWESELWCWCGCNVNHDISPDEQMVSRWGGLRHNNCTVFEQRSNNRSFWGSDSLIKGKQRHNYAAFVDDFELWCCTERVLNVHGSNRKKTT